MRLTVLNDDPGRKIDARKERYEVRVNGEVIKSAYSADDEKGEVIAAVLDHDGLIMVEHGEVKKKQFMAPLK